MPRVPRSLQWPEGTCSHLKNRGHNREEVFTDDEDRRAFLDLVARCRDRFGFPLLHYCLMTNDFHLLDGEVEHARASVNPSATIA